jgi:cytochrome c biogenesis factor
MSGRDYRIMNKVISFLISTLCGSLVLSGLSFSDGYEQMSLNHFIDQITFGFMYIAPFIIVLGIPSPCIIDAIIKNQKRHKHIVELVWYVVFAVITAAVSSILISLLISIDDNNFFINLGLFKPSLFFSLSCSVPFGICSILLNSRIKKNFLQ